MLVSQMVGKFNYNIELHNVNVISIQLYRMKHINIYVYNSKSLDVVQSLYFGSKLPSLGTYKYLYVPDEGSLLPKYRDCTTSNDFELYLMCCGVMLLLLIVYIYIYIYTYTHISIYIYIHIFSQHYVCIILIKNMQHSNQDYEIWVWSLIGNPKISLTNQESA